MTTWHFTQENLDKYDAAQRNDVIEECALVAEAKLDDHDPVLGEWIAAAIRALKDKP